MRRRPTSLPIRRPRAIRCTRRRRRWPTKRRIVTEQTAVLIERAQDGTLATVRLNRPNKRNALTLAMWGDLDQAFRLLEKESGLRCIVVRGAGGNFAAGADLSEFPALRGTTEQAEAY